MRVTSRARQNGPGRGGWGRYPCSRSDSGCKSRLGPSWRVWGRVWPGVWPVVGLLSGWAGPGWPVGWSVSGWPMLANLNQGVDHVGGRVAKCPTFAPACPCYQGRVSHCSRHCSEWARITDNFTVTSDSPACCSMLLSACRRHWSAVVVVVSGSTSTTRVLVALAAARAAARRSARA